MTFKPFCPELTAAMSQKISLDIADFSSYLERIAKVVPDEPESSLCQVCKCTVPPGRLMCGEHREQLKEQDNGVS
jgi:hypothetical protein